MYAVGVEIGAALLRGTPSVPGEGPAILTGEIG